MTNKALLVAIALAIPSAAAAENFAKNAAPHKVQVGTMKSFDYGSSYVHTDERQELQRIAHLWRQRKGWTTITVEGHGFVANNEEESIRLGEKRAERVRDLLVKMGVDAKYVIAVGNSRTAPGRFVDITVDTCDRCRPSKP